MIDTSHLPLKEQALLMRDTLAREDCPVLMKDVQKKQGYKFKKHIKAKFVGLDVKNFLLQHQDD